MVTRQSFFEGEMQIGNKSDRAWLPLPGVPNRDGSTQGKRVPVKAGGKGHWQLQILYTEYSNRVPIRGSERYEIIYTFLRIKGSRSGCHRYKRRRPLIMVTIYKMRRAMGSYLKLTKKFQRFFSDPLSGSLTPVRSFVRSFRRYNNKPIEIRFSTNRIMKT
jgi:hypothetical protein